MNSDGIARTKGKAASIGANLCYITLGLILIAK